MPPAHGRLILAAAVRIGCSGWSYRDWVGPFYPREVRAKDRFAFYASQFETTEINASFYRLPSEKAVATWAQTAPEGFVFAWKVSRYITHNKKLKDCEDSSIWCSGEWRAWGRLTVRRWCSFRRCCGGTTNGWPPS